MTNAYDYFLMAIAAITGTQIIIVTGKNIDCKAFCRAPNERELLNLHTLQILLEATFAQAKSDFLYEKIEKPNFSWIHQKVEDSLGLFFPTWKFEVEFGIVTAKTHNNGCLGTKKIYL